MRRLLVVAVTAGVVVPLLPLLVWAVAGTWRYPDLVPSRFSDRGLSLLVSTDVLRALGTSALVGVCVAALACAIGLPAGRAIGLHRFRGRRLVQFLLVAPVIVPGLAVTLGLQVFFIRLGLSGTVVGVIAVQLVLTVPYAATILGAAFGSYDVDIERQARTLGAGPLRSTLLVTIPALAPSLAATALLTFLISWSEYILTLLVGGGRVQTLPIVLFAAIRSSDTQVAAALGLFVVLPPVLLVIAAAGVLRGRQALLAGRPLA